MEHKNWGEGIEGRKKVLMKEDQAEIIDQAHERVIDWEILIHLQTV